MHLSFMFRVAASFDQEAVGSNGSAFELERFKNMGVFRGNFSSLNGEIYVVLGERGRF